MGADTRTRRPAYVAEAYRQGVGSSPAPQLFSAQRLRLRDLLIAVQYPFARSPDRMRGCRHGCQGYDERRFLIRANIMVASEKQESSGKRYFYRVGPGMHVQLDYRVRDAEGEAVGPDIERLSVIFGAGQLLARSEEHTSELQSQR